ncbi:hypothetical protein BD410DRAFT_803007 [Rickenella mellea]|uniref:Uncharacterized protein n=1 Tax=Rickenella mellea TaxID=50990 RepID=A0A4Y7Q698_9AGAM|nr:hypothetical protein BD410DRAFT_803007 [Rickenella mellea]
MSGYPAVGKERPDGYANGFYIRQKISGISHRNGTKWVARLYCYVNITVIGSLRRPHSSNRVDFAGDNLYCTSESWPTPALADYWKPFAYVPVHCGKHIHKSLDQKHTSFLGLCKNVDGSGGFPLLSAFQYCNRYIKPWCQASRQRFCTSILSWSTPAGQSSDMGSVAVPGGPFHILLPSVLFDLGKLSSAFPARCTIQGNTSWGPSPPPGCTSSCQSRNWFKGMVPRDAPASRTLVPIVLGMTYGPIRVTSYDETSASTRPTLSRDGEPGAVLGNFRSLKEWYVLHAPRYPDSGRKTMDFPMRHSSRTRSESEIDEGGIKGLDGAECTITRFYLCNRAPTTA